MSRDQGRRVEIHLGTLCNNRCVFCMSGMERDHKEPWAELSRVKPAQFTVRACSGRNHTR